MSQDARFTASAAVTLQTLRESITAMRQTIEQVLSSSGHDPARASGEEAFRRAWALAVGTEQACRGVIGVMIAYRDFAAPSWNTRVRQVMTELGRVPDGTAADLLGRHARLLGDLSVLLAALDTEVRDHAMLALGTGNVISDADLDALLAPPDPPAA